jgi:hypothetical protein
MPAPRKKLKPYELPAELELLRILTIEEAASVSSMSVDAIKKTHADKIIRLGERRLGIRLRDALLLGGPAA